jgi:hypothetical protein
MRLLIGVAALGIVLAPSSAAAQPTRCAECHFANLSEVPSPNYLGDWEHSAHARHGVGCDRCHGGDPLTYQPIEAHKGVLDRANLNSPIHPANLAATCAPCHQAIAVAFSGGLHQVLLDAARGQSPTCVTCHGAMSARVPSPAALETRCASCHAPGTARGDDPALMRASLETLNGLRERCDRLTSAVERVSDATERLELRLKVASARDTLLEAVAGAHTFRAQTVRERVGAASRQLDAVADALVESSR